MSLRSDAQSIISASIRAVQPDAAVQRALQGGAHLVGQRAHGGALLGGQAAHLLEHCRQLALFAQVTHPQLVQGGGVADVLKGGERLGADFC